MRLEDIPVVVVVESRTKEVKDDYRKRSGSGGSTGISESESEDGLNASLLLLGTSANTSDSSGGTECDEFSETQGQSPSQNNVNYAGALISGIRSCSHPEQDEFVCVPSSPFAASSDKDASAAVATATALTNDLILEEICRHLPVSDLKNIRLASKLFKEKATSLLLKIDALEVSLWYSVARNSYTRFKRGENSTELDDLSRLIKLSDNKEKFPCTAIRFVYALEFNFDMITFFSRYGSTLKSVSLALDKPVKSKVLRELLLSKAPNLKRLEFRYFESYEDAALVGDDNDLFPDNCEDKPVVLPHLTYLYVGLIPSERVKKMVLSLVKAAVNLQSFEGFQLEYSDILKDAGKENIVTEFDYHPALGNRKFVEAFSNISPLKFPRLTKLTFHLFESRKKKDGMKSVAGKTLISILGANKTTLKKIGMGPIGHYPEIQLPVLDNVSELRLLPWSCRQTFPIFSPGFNIRATFPCLQICDLTHLSLCNDSLADYFPGEDFKLARSPELSTDTFATVKCLRIHNAMSESDLVFMSYKFPNVTKVQLYCVISVLIENRMWTLPEKVESIEFYGFHVSTLGSRPYFLDTFFTGIPSDVAENLCKDLDPESRLKTEFAKYQRCQSMNSLKSLKSVRVFFHQTFELFGSPPSVDGEQYPSHSCSPFITHVTSHFVFCEMPSEFKMQFSYDHGTQLAPYLKEVLQPMLSDSISISRHDERYKHFSWST